MLLTNISSSKCFASLAWLYVVVAENALLCAHELSFPLVLPQLEVVPHLPRPPQQQQARRAPKNDAVSCTETLRLLLSLLLSQSCFPRLNLIGPVVACCDSDII